MHITPIEELFNAQLTAMLPDRSKGASIAIAVSGGSDSMALALLTHHYCMAHDYDCIALTVDHGLRAESASEALQVASWLAEHGIKQHVLRWEGDKPESNIQSHARHARYRLLGDYCRNHNIQYLLLGHHQQDQAETLCMRLLRGSGLTGLSGMRATRADQGLIYLRPLLPFTKKALQSYLQSKSQPWINDPSNKNEAYDRVWIRNLLASHRDADHLANRLCNTAERLQQTEDFVLSQLQALWREHIHLDPLGFISCDADWFLNAHPELQYRSLQRSLQSIRGFIEPYRHETLQHAINSIKENTASKHTLYGCVLERKKHRLYCYREPARVASAIALNIKPILWDQRWRITLNDTDIENHMIAALGKAAFDTHKVKDHLTKEWEKLPKGIFYGLPAIWHLEKLIAIPHIEMENTIENTMIQCEFASQDRFCL
jgi:tRNA(Ile)-lysidine synthase